MTNDDGSTHGVGVTKDDNYGDRLEGILGDLQTAAPQARPDVENQVGAEEPHDKESFLEIVMRDAKCNNPGFRASKNTNFLNFFLQMCEAYSR